MSLEQAAQWIREKDDFLLITHVNPDGDGLGSQSALYLALKHLGKRVRVVNHDPLPRCYQWLPFHDVVEVSDVLPPHQVCIVLDVGEISRIRDGAQQGDFGPILNIDHHRSGSGYGALNWVDPEAAATGEMVYRLIQYLGVPVDKDIAESIYTAIITDTGGFRYANTTPQVLRMAAELMDCGADARKVCDRIFARVSHEAMELVRLSLSHIQTFQDGRIGVMTLTQKDFLSSGAMEEDTDGLVNHVRKLDSVEVAVFLKERPDGRVRLSMRSRNGLDVAVVALKFGGGGHRFSAGAILDGPLEEAVGRVVADISAALQKK